MILLGEEKKNLLMDVSSYTHQSSMQHRIK